MRVTKGRLELLRFGRLVVALTAALCAASGVAWASEPALGHVPADDGCYRVSVRDEVLEPVQPKLEGERLVLSTVGVVDSCGEHEEFHPLVSFLVDQSFPEAPRGEWLALWNLGRKSPGWLSRMRAAFPAFLAKKRARGRELRGLEKKIARLEAEEGRSRNIPGAHLDVTEKHRRSKIGLVLSSIKSGLGFGLRRSGLDHIAFPVQVFYRNYLLRARDLQQREFEHSYLGLLWYDDLARGGEDLSLHPEWVEEIKFRLLADRHILGTWVDPDERQHFVHGYESELRDHLWGTSCFLASVANLHHLGYEEVQRYSATGVPLALGGILYYDPELAPEPSQVEWSVANPFDLTYNPFKNEEVQRAARGGQRVPLALYVYQSNLALKPIIAVDFFRPDNPRLREAATYWRRLGNEALSSVSNVDLIYEILRRSSSFAANRKGLTWFTDKKLALGLEELRLSLISHMYFEPDRADEMLEQLERALINPLVQPGKVQRLRARYHHGLLLANQGAEVIELGRRLRDKKVRRALDLDSKRVSTEHYAEYRQFLEQKEAARTLKLYLAEAHLSGVPRHQLQHALQVLARKTTLEQAELLETIQRFRRRLELESGFQHSEDIALEGRVLLARTDQTLLDIYQRSGRGEADLRADLAVAEAIWAERGDRERAKRQKDQASRFEKELKDQLKFLEGFAQNQGDLKRFSPWYVADALDFFSQVPEVLEFNPVARQRYAKFAPRVEALLSDVQKNLAEGQFADLNWLDRERIESLALVETVHQDLLEHPKAAKVEADGSSSGGRLQDQ